MKALTAAMSTAGSQGATKPASIPAATSSMACARRGSKNSLVISKALSGWSPPAAAQSWN